MHCNFFDIITHHYMEGITGRIAIEDLVALINEVNPDYISTTAPIRPFMGTNYYSVNSVIYRFSTNPEISASLVLCDRNLYSDFGGVDNTAAHYTVVDIETRFGEIYHINSDRSAIEMSKTDNEALLSALEKCHATP